MPASAQNQTSPSSLKAFYIKRAADKNLHRHNRNYARRFLQGVSSIELLYELAPLTLDALRLSLHRTTQSLVSKIGLRRHYLEFERLGIKHYLKHRQSIDLQIAFIKGQYCALKEKINQNGG